MDLKWSRPRLLNNQTTILLYKIACGSVRLTGCILCIITPILQACASSIFCRFIVILLGSSTCSYNNSSSDDKYYGICPVLLKTDGKTQLQLFIVVVFYDLKYFVNGNIQLIPYIIASSQRSYPLVAFGFCSSSLLFKWKIDQKSWLRIFETWNSCCWLDNTLLNTLIKILHKHPKHKRNIQ